MNYKTEYLTKLENFLENYRCDNDDNPTHLSYGKFSGKFILNKEQRKQFMNLYYKAIKHGNTLSIIEKPLEYGPLVIDIDIKMMSDNSDRLYNNDMINKLIELYTNELKNYVNNDIHEYNYFIFEKDKPTIKDNIIKDGFHIMVPLLCLNYNDKFYLREQVIKKAIEMNLFNNYLESVDKIIDKSIIKTNGWFLYGSTKPDRLDNPYKITKIINYNSNDNKYEDVSDYVSNFTLKNIIKHLSITNSSIYNESTKISCKNIIINNPTVIVNYSINNNQPIKDNNKFEIIKNLLNILNDFRADDYENWRNVGFIINNELDDSGHNLFIDFSKRSSKYNDKEVNKFYFGIKKKDSGLRLPTLKMYAKEDNIDEYNKLFKNYDKIKEDFNNNEYNKLKIEFEKTHFKIKNPTAFVCLYDDKIIFKKKSDLTITYENMYYPIIKECNEHKEIKDKKSFINDWIKDEKIRTYQEIDFRPKQKIPSNIYNTFKHYYAETKQLSNDNIDIKNTKLWKHLFNLCGCENIVLEYVLNCLANIIQQPYNKTNVCLLFKSNEGSGKDSFFNWFGSNILGSQYYLNDSNIDLIFGKFNNLLENKVLVVINETEHNDTMKTIGKIKDAITKPTNKIEYKGVDCFQQQNNVFYVYLTNNNNPLPLQQTDRRICAIECNNDICNNGKYFSELHQELNSGKIDRLFYDFLNNRNIKDYKFTDNRPITKYYRELKMRNKPIIVQYLCDSIIDLYNKNNIELSSSDMYDNFKKYLSHNGYPSNYSNTKFGLDLKQFDSIQKVKSNINKYIINIYKLKEQFIKLGYYEEIEFIE